MTEISIKFRTTGSGTMVVWEIYDSYIVTDESTVIKTGNSYDMRTAILIATVEARKLVKESESEDLTTEQLENKAFINGMKLVVVIISILWMAHRFFK